MLVDKINKNEALRPFLAVYPFQVDRTQVRIKFQEDGMSFYRDGSFFSATRTKDGKIRYDKMDTYREHGSMLVDPILVKEESYDEALRLVRPAKK